MTSMVYDEDGMGRYRQVILDVCEDLAARGVVSSLNDWAKKAGFSSSSLVRNFIKGDTRSLSIETYAALASVAKCPIATLLGEDVPRSEKERLILQGYRLAPTAGKAALEAQALRELGETEER
jgi:transcriptional regulator with XRE-family HTH domain